MSTSDPLENASLNDDASLNSAAFENPPAREVALVTCTECGAELSPYVSRCPRCGHHAHHVQAGNWGWREKMTVFFISLLVASLVMALIWVFSGGLGDQRPPGGIN